MIHLLMYVRKMANVCNLLWDEMQKNYEEIWKSKYSRILFVESRWWDFKDICMPFFFFLPLFGRITQKYYFQNSIVQHMRSRFHEYNAVSTDSKVGFTWKASFWLLRLLAIIWDWVCAKDQRRFFLLLLYIDQNTKRN